MRVWVLLWVWVVGLAAAVTSEWSYEGGTITLAHLNISYVDPATGHHRTDVGEVGKFASGAVGMAAGVLVVGHTTADGGGANRYNRHGCSTPWVDTPPSEPWVALVSRGRCSDRDKVANAMSLNASAILVYARDTQAHLHKIALSSLSREQRGVVVFLGHQKGEDLARLVENGTKIYVTINKGQEVKYKVTNINRTSVLFVSVSFIILMVISLAWLLFYYIQRFRYIHAKDRLARHLCNAAKKALAKIPVKNLKSGDKEVSAESECCAVCIEPYQVSDTVRTLPCKHEFHKNCVDPWLLEHRTCPMCKMDILKFYGYVFTGSTETVLPMDEIELEITLSDSEESVLQLDVMEETPVGDVEVRVPTPPPPAHPRTMPHVSQVMVVPRPETASPDRSCEGRPDSPVPDTPISPVHQPESTIPPCSATSSGLLSILSSARTRTSPSTRLSHSSQVASSSATSPPPRSPTPQVDKEVSLEENGISEGCPCDRSQEKNDLEVSSVCSDDFSDALSTHSASEVVDIEGRLNSQDSTNLNSATNSLYVTTCEPETPTPFCVSVSSATPSVPSSAQTRSPPRTGSPNRKGSASRRRSASRKRSSSKKRSTSRARSTSRRRSSSHARSPSRGRSSMRQESPHPRTSAFSRSAREQSRPSSHIVNVSHV